MKTHNTVWFRLLGPLLAVVLLLAASLSAQSLGEVARQQRAKKGPPASKSKVYTNDNIPREGGLSTTSVEPPAKGKAGEKEKEAATTAAAGEKEKAATAGAGEAKKASADEEKAWREKFTKLRETLAFEEKRLDILQREYNLATVQAYSDPNAALREQTLRTELNNRQAEIEKQKQSVEQAKKAIADLEDELRRGSLPPGWAR